MITPLLPGASLTKGPSDWQILQQDPDGFAEIHLEGVYRTEAPEFRVEARAVEEATGRLPLGAPDWTMALLGPNATWSLSLRLPAGGLYRLETRVWRQACPDTRPMRGDYVHHLGVGDLWVIAGQSNASGTGTGAAEDPPTLGLHQLGQDEKWKLATHPLEDATHTKHPATVHGVFQAHAPWLSFARRLHGVLDYPIGLIPAALGGSPISLWQPGAKLFENLVDLVAVAGGKIKGVVWHQGESDAFGKKSADYPDAFRAMVKGLRKRLESPDLAFVTGQLALWTEAEGEDGHREYTQMREHQRRLARELGHEVVPLLDLPIGDEVHLTANANLEMGRRYGDTALASVYKKPVRLPGISLIKAKALGGPENVLRLTFDLGPAGWVQVGRRDIDFRVEDQKGPVGVAHLVADDRGFVDLVLERPLVPPATVHGHDGGHPRPSLRDRDQRPITGFSEVVVVL